jgi:23S rRNA-/tRNA-specific pseudouridylate synthase
MVMMMRCNVSIIQQAIHITSLSQLPSINARRRCCLLSPIFVTGVKRLFSSEQQQPQKPQQYSRLHPPTVIYSDNHLLVVNKPAGWHAVPNIPKQRNDDYDNNSNNNNSNKHFNNNHENNKKCLLTYLQNKQLGGGSKNDFLIPLHRIDQPCTGILLFGKTSKAASRVTTVWKGKKMKKKKNKNENENDINNSNNNSNNDNSNSNENQKQPQFIRGVTKDYLCVVPTSRLIALEEASKKQPDNDNDNDNDNKGKTNTTQQPLDEWYCLEGAMLKQSSSSSRRNQGRIQHEQQRRPDSDHVLQQQNKKGRSVVIVKRRLQQEQKFNNNNDNDVNDDDYNNYNNNNDNHHHHHQSGDASYVRPVSIKWKKIMTKDKDVMKPAYTLLLVRTSEGARHMVRALLAQVGNCPIIGDVRYWTPSRYSNNRIDGGDDSNNNHNNDDGNDSYSNSSNNTTGNTNQPLMDKSVALHAYGVYFDNPNQKLKLGTLNTFEFRAPIPSTWKTYFGIQNVQLS